LPRKRGNMEAGIKQIPQLTGRINIKDGSARERRAPARLFVTEWGHVLGRRGAYETTPLDNCRSGTRRSQVLGNCRAGARRSQAGKFQVSAFVPSDQTLFLGEWLFGNVMLMGVQGRAVLCTLLKKRKISNYAGNITKHNILEKNDGRLKKALKRWR
jgi:hypothetical protein